MNLKRLQQSFQIGFTYIGTVVGAGFASGQEILKFFTIYQQWSYLAIFVSTILFAWVGTKMLLIGARLNADSYRQLTAYLFGEKLAYIIDMFMMVMLFGVTVAMLAGVGALFHENLRLPFQIGIVFTMVATYFTIRRGMKGILAANTVIVPIMISMICFIFIQTVLSSPAEKVPFDKTSYSMVNSVTWLTSAISYAAFNLGLAVSVLVPLGNEIQDKKTLIAGGCIGATGLGGMLIGTNYSLTQKMPGIMDYEIPIAFISSAYGNLFQVLFILVLWGEIFSTLIANVYGLGSQITTPRYSINGSLIIVLILTSAFFVSQIGFSNIVTYLYPLFGYLSFLLLVMLMWPKKGKL